MEHWEKFNVLRLLDQTELDKAFNLSLPPQPAASVPSISSEAQTVLVSPLRQAWTISSQLSILLSPNAQLAKAASSTSSLLSSSSGSVSNPDPNISCSVLNKGIPDINLFSGVFEWSPDDREVLLDSIQKKVIASYEPKTPSNLQKRVCVLKKIHEALQARDKALPSQTNDPCHEEEHDPASPSSVKELTSTLSPAIQLAITAFMSLRQRLDFMEPRFCRKIIDILKPIFADAASSRVEMSFDSPILLAISSFLKDTIRNSELNMDVRTEALEILVQLYIGQSSIAGLLYVVQLLLENAGSQFCELQLLLSVSFLSKMVKHANSLGLSPDLYSFGRGDTGRLGQGPANASVQFPQILDSLTGKNVSTVATFSTHSLAITDSGDVYAWGNGQHGRLGTKSLANAPSPMLLKPIIGQRIIAVTVGLSHSVLLSDQGRVFSFGNGINGRLGTGDTKERRAPTLVQSLSQHSITGISCGSAFTFALGECGSLFSWGKNTTGQCGHGNLSECHTPKRIAALSNENIIHVAGGWDHALACSSRGIVYSWGCGYEGTRPVLGNGSKSRQHTPTPIEKLNGVNVVKVAAGYDHSLAISDKGEVFTWGSSAVGQLGLGDTAERLFPEKIQSLDRHVIVSADGGMDHTLLISSEGEVFACGNGAENALGIQCSGPQVTPQLVESLEGKYIRKVACGDKCSIVLSTTRNHSVPSSSGDPLTPQKILKCKPFAVDSSLQSDSGSVAWKQAIVHCLGAMDALSLQFVPNQISFWDGSSTKDRAKKFEKFAINICKETFESLAEILELLLRKNADSFLSEPDESIKKTAEQAVNEGEEHDAADELFLPFIFASCLRILKANIWQAVCSQHSFESGQEALDASISRRLYQSIVELMEMDQNLGDKMVPEFAKYIRGEASEVFVLGIGLWFPSKQLHADLLKQVINGELHARFPDVMPFGVTIEDAMMKRLSEQVSINNFIDSDDSGTDTMLVSTLMTLIRSIPADSIDPLSGSSSDPRSFPAASDRKDSGTSIDAGFNWVRSPVNQIQKMTVRPAASPPVKQRGVLALLIAFQQVLVHQAFLQQEVTDDDRQAFSFVDPAHMVAYAFNLFDYCCLVLKGSQFNDAAVLDTTLKSLLPIFLTTLQLFSKNLVVACALLVKLKSLCQSVETAQSELQVCSWLVDLEISTVDLCGQFLKTILLNEKPVDHDSFPQVKDFVIALSGDGCSVVSLRVCALRFLADLVRSTNNFLVLDALLTSVVSTIVGMVVDVNDQDQASALHTLMRLIMEIPRRHTFSVMQQQALTMRILPFMSSQFMFAFREVRDELGVMTFLRDCIWRIQYRSKSDNEEALLMLEVHKLAALVFQSTMLRCPESIDSVLNSLHHELSAAAVWSLSSSALRSNSHDHTNVSWPLPLATLIGPSCRLGSEPTDLPNVLQDTKTDFTMSTWLWVAPSSPCLILQFKDQPPLLYVDGDSVQIAVGSLHIQHDVHLEPFQWSLLTLTLKNRQLRLYIDDALAAQQTAASPLEPFSSNEPLLFSGDVDGRISTLRWWKECLTIEHIGDIFTQGPHNVANAVTMLPSSSLTLADVPYDTVPFEYLCCLHCMIGVWDQALEHNQINWASVLTALLCQGTLRIRIVVLRILGRLLRDEDLLACESVLWSLCHRVEKSPDHAEISHQVNSNDNVSMFQESVRLYQRMLSRAPFCQLFLSRLQKVVSTALVDANEDPKGDLQCVLALMGGFIEEVAVGSCVALLSGAVGTIAAMHYRSSLCVVIVEQARSDQEHRLHRLERRQEISSKCLLRKPLLFTGWSSDMVKTLAPLLIKSVEQIEQIVIDSSSSQSKPVFWANVPNQILKCICTALSSGSLPEPILDTMTDTGVITAIARLSSRILPSTIEMMIAASSGLNPLDRDSVMSSLRRPSPE